ncbi:hypothetical protein [Sphingomicrobium astaxanthinifaciens]|uniref:hypothetical protein n=1 Tax=Sphingomicrobium astaxanthinifaciens TaxID=1227949 RepID=UPI001FCC5BD2|nr:hypothetical protein [Sphingomicrobium astaxanthinifaciens]MCJ7420971.1 hypothetical protein [Sphingomicrobium astaxanthinifaciens]
MTPHAPAPLLALALAALALAGCGSRATSAAPPTPSANYSLVAATTPASAGLLLGAGAAVLLGRFGAPALQVAEGDSLMLQWRTPGCTLDAYLYPDRRGGAETAHVEARGPDGKAVDREACIRAIERAR